MTDSCVLGNFQRRLAGFVSIRSCGDYEGSWGTSFLSRSVQSADRDDGWDSELDRCPERTPPSSGGRGPYCHHCWHDDDPVTHAASLARLRHCCFGPTMGRTTLTGLLCAAAPSGGEDCLPEWWSHPQPQSEGRWWKKDLNSVKFWVNIQRRQF